MKKINFNLPGKDKDLCFKHINGYKLHICEGFSLIDDYYTYKLHIKNPGFNGKWYVFLIDGKKIATNNVWPCDIDKTKPNDDHLILERDLDEKPSKKDIIIADISLLHEKAQDKLMNRMTTGDIWGDSKYKREKLEKGEEFYTNRKGVCEISLDSDQYELYVIKDTKRNRYEFYCVVWKHDIPDASPHYIDDDLNIILEIMIKKYMTEDINDFYTCCVYGDEYFQLVLNKFKKTKKHKIIEPNMDFSMGEIPYDRPIHSFNVSKIK
jgi:hypothetical protein